MCFTLYLDCHDLRTALSSLACAAKVAVNQLAETLRAYDISRANSRSEPPWKQMPREVLEQLGTAPGKLVFGGAYYFHGTRVVEPERFSIEGILPLDQMVERIWQMLYQLAADECPFVEWAKFRTLVEKGDARAYGMNCAHFAHLYRLKVLQNRVDSGPFGLLVRDSLLYPHDASSHDYLAIPEIVQDIAICYAAVHGGDLEQRFRSASRPCIVKFRTNEAPVGAVCTALNYAHLRLQGERISDVVNWCADCEGKSVPCEDIIGVEVLSAE